MLPYPNQEEKYIKLNVKMLCICFVLVVTSLFRVPERSTDKPSPPVAGGCSGAAFTALCFSLFESCQQREEDEADGGRGAETLSGFTPTGTGARTGGGGGGGMGCTHSKVTTRTGSVQSGVRGGS